MSMLEFWIFMGLSFVTGVCGTVYIMTGRNLKRMEEDHKNFVEFADRGEKIHEMHLGMERLMDERIKAGDVVILTQREKIELLESQLRLYEEARHGEEKEADGRGVI